MKIQVKIEIRTNSNPDNGPLGRTGYLAMETWPKVAGWRGCPLGRSETKTGAVLDLLSRANEESQTSFTVDDIEVVSEPE